MAAGRSDLACVSKRLVRGFPFVAAEIFDDDDFPLGSMGSRNGSRQAWNSFPLIGPMETQGILMRSTRKAAMKERLHKRLRRCMRAGLNPEVNGCDGVQRLSGAPVRAHSHKRPRDFPASS